MKAGKKRGKKLESRRHVWGPSNHHFTPTHSPHPCMGQLPWHLETQLNFKNILSKRKSLPISLGIMTEAATTENIEERAMKSMQSKRTEKKDKEKADSNRKETIPRSVRNAVESIYPMKLSFSFFCISHEQFVSYFFFSFSILLWFLFFFYKNLFSP